VITDELGTPVHPEWYSDEFGRLLRPAGCAGSRCTTPRHTILVSGGGISTHGGVAPLHARASSACRPGHHGESANRLVCARRGLVQIGRLGTAYCRARPVIGGAHIACFCTATCRPHRWPTHIELARLGASAVSVSGGRVALNAPTGNRLEPSSASSVIIRPSSAANLPACPAPAQTSTRWDPGT
jgi:hypothetical protein